MASTYPLLNRRRSDRCDLTLSNFHEVSREAARESSSGDSRFLLNLFVRKCILPPDREELLLVDPSFFGSIGMKLSNRAGYW